MAGGWLRCRACRKQTSLTAGTIFEGTRKPLRMWFELLLQTVLNISTTTSTNSPSASIAADQRPAGCSFIASPNKPSPLDPRPTTPSSSHRVPATPGQRGNEGDTQFCLIS